MGNISDEGSLQMDLFDPIYNRKERTDLMHIIDRINHRYGVKTIKLLAEGERQQPWQVKCDFRSQNYLTDINEILTVNI
jgi:DNA polymerase V